MDSEVIQVKTEKEILQDLKLFQAKANLVRDGPNKLTPPPTTPEWVSKSKIHLVQNISYLNR